jgi:hypothetical protein
VAERSTRELCAHEATSVPLDQLLQFPIKRETVTISELSQRVA